MKTFHLPLLRLNKPEQESIKLWFATPKKFGKTKNHTPIETLTLKELYEIKVED